MNGNQITISVNSDDFDQLRKIARTRGQTVSDYIGCLVSSNLMNAQSPASSSAGPAVNGLSSAAGAMESNVAAPTILKEARARLR